MKIEEPYSDSHSVAIQQVQADINNGAKVFAKIDPMAARPTESSGGTVKTTAGQDQLD